MNFHKFKDRSPQETIAIIQNFFESRGYKIITVFEVQSEIGSWSHSFQLYKNNQFIMSSNGKGSNKIFSIASGYAELYERFCNKCGLLTNPVFMGSLMDYNYNKYGYYLSNDEKMISLEDTYNLPAVKQFFEFYFDCNKQWIDTILDYLIEDKSIGVKFSSIDRKDNYYWDPRIISAIGTGSTGMAAGNSLEEALNQGISEICERVASRNILYYSSLNLKQISEEYLNNLEFYKQYKTKMDILGYDIKVIDLSYMFCLPVVMTLMSSKNGNLYINFGSFPVFSVALERTLTELYQGQYSWEYEHDIRIPYAQNIVESKIAQYASTNLKNFFPEEIQYTIIDSPNADYFIQAKTNEEVLSYYIELEKRNNIHFYYTDNSLDKNIYSIYVYSPELDISRFKRDINIKCGQRDKELQILFIKKLKELIIQFRQDIYSFDSFKQLLKIAYRVKDFNFILRIIHSDPFCLINNFGSITMNFLHILDENIDENNKLIFFNRTIYYNIIKQYLTYIQYKNLDYDDEKIQKVFPHITLFNLNNLDDIIYKIYYNISNNCYHSNLYQEVIKSYG